MVQVIMGKISSKAKVVLLIARDGNQEISTFPSLADTLFEVLTGNGEEFFAEFVTHVYPRAKKIWGYEDVLDSPCTPCKMAEDKEEKPMTAEEIEQLLQALYRLQPFIRKLDNQPTLTVAEELLSKLSYICDRWS